MTKRGTLKVISKDLSKCWYCLSKTNCALTFPDGSEIWSCVSCAIKHGKVKRIPKKAYQSSPTHLSKEKSQKSLINFSVMPYKQEELIPVSHGESR